MRNVWRTVATAMIAGSLVMAYATPVSATEVGMVFFTGKAVKNPGLWLPGAGPPTSGTWSFASGTANPPLNQLPGCVAGSVSLKKAVPVSAGSCFLSAYGSYTGPLSGAQCGLSSGGPGTGTLTQGAQTYNLNNVGWTESAGGLLVVTGTVTKTSTNAQGPGQFVALVHAVPDQTKEPLGRIACLTWPARYFYVVGVGVYVV